MNRDLKRYLPPFWISLCLLAGLVSITRGQDDCGDLRNYHYYNAYSFFHHNRSNDIDLAGLQNFLNPVLDFPYYVLTLLFPRSPRAVAFFMGMPFGLLAYFSIQIGRHLFSGQPSKWASISIAALFGLSGTAAFSQLGLTTNEIPTAALVTAALFYVLTAIENDAPGFSRPILTAGFLGGLAVGCKLTSGPYAIALALATIVGFRHKKMPLTLIALGSSGSAGLLFTGGFWMVHLFMNYQNPIFPYHNELFHSRWAAWNSYEDNRFFPNPGLQTIFYPFWWIQRNAGLVTEYPFRDGRVASVFMVIALSALGYLLRFKEWKKAVPPAWRAVIMFWIAGYVLWLEEFSIYRYAVPLEIVGGFLFVGGLQYIFGKQRILGLSATAISLSVVFWLTLYPDWGHIPFQKRSVPASEVSLPENTLVISAAYYPTSYVGTLAGPSAVFVDGAFDYFVPPFSPLDNLVTSKIDGWTGPLDVLKLRSGDQTPVTMLENKYRIATTSNCEVVESAWDADALEMCQAYRLREDNDYQKAVAFSFKNQKSLPNFALSGWSPPNSWGVWSVGADASIIIPLNKLRKDSLLLTFTAKGFVLGKESVKMELYANDIFAGSWSFSGSEVAHEAIIPAMANVDQLTLRFHIDNPVSPAELGLSQDQRKLGINLEQIMIQDPEP